MERYRCDPQVLKACKIRKLYGCDGYYLGASFRCANDNQSIMAETEYQELQAYRATGLTVERAAELGKADREGRVIILQYSVKPLVWGDNAHETVLCPTCGHDLMGKFDDESAGHPIMYQCCYCGESVDSKTIISREEAEKALEAKNHERPDDQ